ncbi:MAG: hypothetical protein KJ645_11305, partial [Planctomycetes bacterium]|nr:hypothetical protein [Planctomycetota bacterium]
AVDPGDRGKTGDPAPPDRRGPPGKVTDPKGNPLPGVRVRAFDLPPLVLQHGAQNLQKDGSLMFEFGIFGKNWFVVDLPAAVFRLIDLLGIPGTSSLKDGTFQLEGVSEGDITVILDKPGFCTLQEGPISFRQSGTVHDLGTLALHEVYKGKGYVKDTRDRPVAGVEVRLGPSYGQSSLCILQPPVFTDENGAFPLQGHANTNTYCALRRHAGEPWMVEGPFYAEIDDLVLTVPSVFDLQVKVFEKQGVPAKQAGLKIRTKDYFSFLTSNRSLYLTDRIEQPNPGDFIVKNLVPGEYEMVAAAPGYGTVVRKFEVDESDLAENIRMEPANILTVTVLNGVDRMPMEEVEVFIKIRSSDWFEDALECSRDRTAAGGTVTFDDLGPGIHMVYAYHPAFAAAMVDVELPKDSKVTLQMRQGGALEGKVHYPKGYLDPPFTLFLTWEGHEGFPFSSFPRFTRTDENGLFFIDHLQPGEWEINAVERLFDKNLSGLFQVSQCETLARSSVEVEEGKTAKVDVVFRASSSRAFTQISGRVVLDGSPAKGTWAELRGADIETATAVNSSGYYTFDHVPAGLIQLRMDIPFEQKGSPAMTLIRECEVFEGQPLIEDFVISTGAVFGRVESGSGGIPSGPVLVNLTSIGSDENQRDGTTLNIMDLAGKDTQEVMSILAPPGSDRGHPFRLEILANQDGSFNFFRVPVGPYRIRSTYKA